MRDGEWVLTHDGGAIAFGLVDQDAFLATFPELGDAELSVDDAPRPRGDGTAFGVDYRSGRTITFDLRAIADSEAAVRGAVGALGRLWRADEVRNTPGAVATLATRQAGRERMAIGRPRRWAVDDSRAKFGVISILCDFQTADDVWYSATGSGVTVDFATSVGGGLVSPLRSPLKTTADSDRSRRLVVNSELSVWPTITIGGPDIGVLTKPRFGIPGMWEIQLDAQIRPGETVQIDTQPWSRSVRAGSANLSGALGRSSIRLSNASIPPGAYDFYFGGNDASGTSSMAITWFDRFTTL